MPGQFDFKQDHIPVIRADIKSIKDSMPFSQETNENLEKIMKLLDNAEFCIDTVDELFSGDINQETFNEKLWK